MSYTPDKQRFGPAIEEAIDAIDHLRIVIEARQDSEDWSVTHRVYLHELDQKLSSLKFELRQLAGNTH